MFLVSTIVSVLMFCRSISPCEVQTCLFALKVDMEYPSSSPPISCEVISPIF